jgi:hypothetical protein
MDIPLKQISYKKKIGKLGSDPVIEIGTKGGFHLVVCARKGCVTTLGTGSHPAIARHIAKKKEPEIEFTELSKGDEVLFEHYQFLLPKYELITQKINEIENE